MQERVRDYDPAVESCVFIYLVDETTARATIRLWQLPSSYFNEPPVIAQVARQTLWDDHLQVAIQRQKKVEQNWYHIKV